MNITCLIKKEGSQYASLCVELDVASCGKSKMEALEGLKRAIETYIEYMVSEVPPPIFNEPILLFQWTQ